MNHKQTLLPIILRVIGFGLGLISLIGGIAAFGRSGEPERYWVAGLVLLFGGILWWLISFIPKFRLQKREWISIFVIFVLGMAFGLLYVFTFCGGECGGDSICHWYRGFPGYWLQFSTCMATSSSSWNIDAPSLTADILFWMDAGLMLSFVWKFINAKAGMIGNKA